MGKAIKVGDRVTDGEVVKDNTNSAMLVMFVNELWPEQ